MGRVRAQVDLPALASQAEDALVRHRPLAGVRGRPRSTSPRVEGDWPRAGARVVWDSHPGGRGRVVERVVALRAAAAARSVEVEDEKVRGTQRVSFAPHEHGGRR